MANVPRPAIRLSSLPGDGGAATPRGGLPAPRTSLFTTAVVGGSSQLLLPPSSQQQQQQQQGGAVRVLLAAPVVPRLALAGMGGFGDGATRSSSPSHPSSSRSAAAFAQAAWQPPQQSASARENEPDNRAHPAAAQGGGGAPAPTPPPRSMFPKTRARREAAAAAAVGDGYCAAGEAPRPAAVVAAPGRERLAPRRSMGGAALRLSVAAFRVSRLPATLGFICVSALSSYKPSPPPIHIPSLLCAAAG